MTLSLNVQDIALKKGHKLLVSNVNLTATSGDAISLTGANGVGKTTFLRCLAGFTPPHRGSIQLVENDSQLDGVSIIENYSHYLGHAEALNPARRVDQELQFHCDYLGGTDLSLREAIARLRLGALLDLETRMLSAGQRKRVSLARLLMVPRPIWLLDEVLSPLDIAHRALMVDIMQAHLSGGGIMVCAVHDPLPFDTRALHLTRPSLEEIGNA
ncbi:heme ABC exporter ATP-binding protein CcmA [Asticcacaulis tiandongensis]|uniref:heme ABC exporter ATP-binding protein CcmA n=1 Tax=Asticcacaulis tiandongensis TaxID=2565365 RepID=UPI00112D0116|nr:heme ABC exporter ATP-binding protein CcmA [Asticcacaulis tiandongensis]